MSNLPLRREECRKHQGCRKAQPPSRPILPRFRVFGTEPLDLDRQVTLAGAGERMTKHSVPAGEVSALLLRFAELKRKARAKMGMSFPIVTIQEAGLDGFWGGRPIGPNPNIGSPKLSPIHSLAMKLSTFVTRGVPLKAVTGLMKRCVEVAVR